MAGLKGLLMLPDSEAEEGESEDAGETGKMAAATDVMDALKSGDKKAFVAAMSDFVELCGGYGSEMPEEEDAEDAEA